MASDRLISSWGVAALFRSAFDLLTAPLDILAGARNGIAARREGGDRKQHDENDFVFHKHLLSGRGKRSQHTAKGQIWASFGYDGEDRCQHESFPPTMRPAARAAARRVQFVTRLDQTP